MTDLPPGAKVIPNAGRPDNAPGLVAERALTSEKRDAAAARGLPDLFERLTVARQMLDRAKATDDLNVHSVRVIIAGDDLEHRPADKKAWADLMLKDLEATVTDLEGKISALGFDPEVMSTT